MKVDQTLLPGVLLIEPKVFNDSRGFFLECFQQSRYREHGIEDDFSQDSHSRSVRGALRGLHFQSRVPQAKLVYVTSGEVFDVVVDIRKGSPTFSHWIGKILNDENHHQLYIPEGFLHGFCALSEVADLQYKFSTPYQADDQCGVIWNDSTIDIDWPLANPVLSEKDLALPPLEKLADELIPRYEAPNGH